MDIAEIIKRQAEAIQSGKSKLEMADHFEAIAKALREQAQPPKKLSFAEITGNDFDKKSQRLEAFGAAIKKDKIRQRDKLLTDAGWVNSFRNDVKGISTWGRKDKAGMRLLIEGGRFRVTFHDEELKPRTDITNLASFLSQKK